jgi:hypothetical protein
MHTNAEHGFVEFLPPTKSRISERFRIYGRNSHGASTDRAIS